MICKYCEKDIAEDSKWFKKSGCWHHECYIKNKMNMKRHKDIEFYEEEADKLYNNRLDSELKNKVKNDFYDYIQSNYNITLIPSYTFIKMASIIDGTYKGLNKGIPYEDLYQMFISKKNTLDKIYSNNVSKGKDMDGIGRFNYDLAILLSQYDKFKLWKETIRNKEIKKIKQEDITNINSVNKIMQKANMKRNDDCDNIDDLINEL